MLRWNRVSSRQDWSSLESKLSEGDILVHIVLRLVHPGKLDLPTKCVFPPNISWSSFSTCLLVNPKLSNLTWQYCSSTGNLAAKYSNTKRQCLFAWLNWARPVEVHVASDVEIKSAGISDHAVIVDSQGGRLSVIGWGANCFCLTKDSS